MADFEFSQREYHDCHSFLGLRMVRSCWSVLDKWEFRDLSAPFWRWYHDEAPGGYLRQSGRLVPLAPDRIYLIPPYTPFGTLTKKPIRQLYLHFVLDARRAVRPGQIHSHKAAPLESRLIRELRRELKTESDARRPGISFLSHALASLALAEVPPEHWDQQVPDLRVEAAMERIRQAAPAALGNGMLAREAGLNVNAFTRLFKASSGYSPHQYLLRLRLEIAFRLLTESGESLESIAERAGFCDRYHFSRTFKQHFGNSPASFRRQGRAG